MVVMVSAGIKRRRKGHARGFEAGNLLTQSFPGTLGDKERSMGKESKKEKKRKKREEGEWGKGRGGGIGFGGSNFPDERKRAKSGKKRE